ncbi:hypothetical protein V6Z11_D09G112000 [Gossypium hirsutum]
MSFVVVSNCFMHGWLGHDIHSTISSDDLVIFAKADIQQAQILKETLDNFCDLSGHWVNARKINIYFSCRVDEAMEDRISGFLGFQRVQNLVHI